MNGEQAIQALRRDDGRALGRAVFEPDVPSAIEQAWSSLGTRARLVATTILPRCSGAAAGKALLALTGDADPRVAIAASEGLLGLERARLPEAAFLTYSIAVRLDAVVRRNLYRVLARTDDASALPALRKLYDQERDPSALAKAHLAAARLGALPERRALEERLTRARPHEIPGLAEDLLDAGDPRWMRAAACWFDDERFVLSAGVHGQEVAIRVCDLAVRTAGRLGIEFTTIEPLSLRRMEPWLIAAAKQATLALGPAIDPVAPRPASLPLAFPSPPLPIAAPPLPLAAPPAPPTAPLVLPTELVRLGELGAQPELRATPFVAPTGGVTAPPPARPKPRFNTGTQDIEQAKAAAMAAVSTPFERRPSPTRPPAEAAQKSLGFESYTWLCALLSTQPAAADQARREHGIDDAAWSSLHAQWQAWLRGDPERWARFQGLLADYQRRIASTPGR